MNAWPSAQEALCPASAWTSRPRAGGIVRYPSIVITEPTEEIAPEEATPLFERLLSSEPFRQAEKCRLVLKTLFQHWMDRKGAVSQKELLTHLQWRLDIQISPIMAAIREKLEIFNRESACQLVFELLKGKGNCQLVIHRRPAHQKGDGGVSIVFGRRDPKDPFEDIVCGSEGEVLFVGIAALSTLNDRIEPWFNSRSIRTTHLRVLSWRPLRSEGLIEACAMHIGHGAPAGLQHTIDAAWERWKKLEQEHDAVEVYAYSALPTALTVYNDRQMKIELLPFNRPGGPKDFNNRPAIFLNRNDHPREFEYFRDWFEDLWFDAMFQALQNYEVLPHRRERATALLRERGFIPTE